jgi:hypothetical protein
MLQRDTVINSIIRNYNLQNPTYLEIGVWKGNTFRFINTNQKDGVDPGQYCDCEFVNYKITSDIFFTNVPRKYDIIFIDGLHTAHQVSKDIYNSIQNLNSGGWIILDDVYPHCKYEQERLDLRKSGAQTGDVWKAVYNQLDKICELSEIVYFEMSTERGNLIFKLKENNTDNISIDTSIPTMNIDGWYTGTDAEWNKYDYDRDFPNYFAALMNINSKSKFIINY